MTDNKLVSATENGGNAPHRLFRRTSCVEEEPQPNSYTVEENPSHRRCPSADSQ